MAKKLTPTELKVLATEGANRLSEFCAEKTIKIKNRKEYKDIEDNFDLSPIGETINQIRNLVSWLYDATQKSGVEIKNVTPVFSEYSRDSIFRELKDVKTRMISNMRNQLFPIPNHTIPVKTINRWGESTYDESFYDYILHRLSFNQLTSDNNLSEILDNLINEISETL